MSAQAQLQVPSPAPVQQPSTPDSSLDDAGDSGLASLQETLGNSFLSSFLPLGASGEDVASDLAGAPHTVAEGDTLWGLAERHLGSGQRWPEIYDENQEVIGDDPDLILPGQILEIGDEEEVCEEEDGAELEEVGECLEDPEQEVNEPELSPEEALAIAETSRESLRGTIDTFQTLPEAERAAILARVDGLEGEALVREMRMIERALSGPNGERALHALAGLEGMLQSNPDAATRLTPDVIEMMIDGVATSRTDSERGQEGILGARRVREAAEALVNMDEATYTETVSLLQSAGTDAQPGMCSDPEALTAVEGADARAEQALILKAVAARRTALGSGASEADRTTALDEVRGFADTIRGTERAELIRTTTLLDVDDENTSSIDPDNIAAGNDAVVDNDGLYQRFTDSCAPTTGQIIRGEIDPVFALQVHTEGLNSADPTTATSQQQQSVLEAPGAGGVAVARLGTQARSNLGSTMDAMEGDGSLTAAQRDVIERLSNNTPLSEEEQATADAVLAQVRARNDGRPTDLELATMQADAGQVGNGMSCGGAINAVNEPNFSTNGTGGAPSASDLDTIEQSLLDGEDVGFRIGYTGTTQGHAMSISDVRRLDDGSRQFLVNDPWSGATRWVTEADLTSGAAFARNTGTFSLGNATVSHYYTED